MAGFPLKCKMKLAKFRTQKTQKILTIVLAWFLLSKRCGFSVSVPSYIGSEEFENILTISRRNRRQETCQVQAGSTA